MTVGVSKTLLLIGMSALALVAATGPTLAKKAGGSVYAETAKSAHYYSKRNWKRRHRVYAASYYYSGRDWKRRPRVYRLRVKRSDQFRYASAYNRRRYETEWLLDCNMNQPFVDCWSWRATDQIPSP
jgi:hypothetical protein